MNRKKIILLFSIIASLLFVTIGFSDWIINTSNEVMPNYDPISYIIYELKDNNVATFDGNEHKPTSDNLPNLYTDNEVTITYKDSNNVVHNINEGFPINVGTYTFIFTYNNQTKSMVYTINPRTLNGAIVTLGPSLTYNGATQTQTVESVYVNGLAVTDYSISGNTNKDAGTYSLTITAEGNYTGTTSVDYTIAKKNISSGTVNLGSELTYNGLEQTKSISSVVVDGLNVTYSVTGNKATNAGNYTLSVTGTGNFEGTISKNYSIAPKSISSATVTGLASSYLYNDGEPVIPSFQVSDGSTQLTMNTDYTVSITNNTAQNATAIITITGIGNYTSSITKTFTITSSGYVVRFYDTDGVTMLAELSVESGASATPPTYDYNSYEKKLTWLVKGTTTEASLSNISENLNVQANLEDRIYNVSIYYTDADKYLGTNYVMADNVNILNQSYKYNDTITLTRLMRINSTINLFYMSPVNTFDWSCISKTTDSTTNTLGNANTICHLNGDDLTIVVLCIQPVAIATPSSTTSIPIDTNTNLSTSTYTFYKNMNSAFSAMSSSSNKILWIYSRSNGTINSNCFTANTTIAKHNVTIASQTFAVPAVNYNLSDVTVSNSYTIPGSVKLMMPYMRAIATSTGYEYEQNAESTGGNTVQSILSIADNATVIFNGDVIVGGWIRGIGSTTSTRCVIINNGNMIINSNLYSYGYVKGNGLVTVNSGATINDMFKIYDWQSGANALGMYNKNVFPFNCYSFHNVSCKTRIYKGATYKAWAQILMSDVWATASWITIVGSGGLFDLTTNGGYLEKSVENTTATTNINGSYTTSNQDITQREILDIYSDFKDNAVSVTAKMSIFSTTIKTSTTLAMPIGFMKINLCSGHGTLATNSYKFLPGSALTINQGATLSINSGVKVVFYENYLEDYSYDNGSATTTGYGNSATYIYRHSAWYKKYGILDSSNNVVTLSSIPKEFGAILTVNGTLTSNGNLGGIIYTDTSSSTVSLANTGATLPILATLTYGKVGSSATTTNVTTDARMYMYNSTTREIDSTTTNCQATTYYGYESSGIFGFVPMAATHSYTISYQTNGALETCNPISVSTVEDGYTITSGILPSINKTGYIFDGWYIDSTFSTPAIGYVITNNQTLYAKWELRTYTLNYHYVYEGCTSSGSVSNSNSITFNVNSNFTLQSATDGELYFLGWYLDSECVGSISLISNSTLKALISTIDANDGVLDLYGLFSSVIKYSVIYYDKDNIPIPTLVFELSDGESITLQQYNFGTHQTSPSSNDYSYVLNTFKNWGIYDTNLTLLTTVNAGSTYTPSCNIYVRPLFNQVNYCNIARGTVTDANISWSGGNDVPAGTSVQFSITYNQTENKIFKIVRTSDNSELYSGSDTTYTYVINSNITVSASSTDSGGCISGDSLITLADGTSMMVKELKVGDLIKTFDHQTGQVSIQPIAYIYYDESNHDVINLYFENGINITIIDGHGFFDKECNEYVVLNKDNIDEYVGHKFYYIDENNNGSFVELLAYDYNYEVIEAYSILTTYDINHIVNGFLAVSDEIEGLYNIFTLDENMKYDQKLMENDISLYGLASYEDFKDYCTFEEFVAFNCQYLYISIGKGLTTFESLAERMLLYTGNSI